MKIRIVSSNHPALIPGNTACQFPATKKILKNLINAFDAIPLHSIPLTQHSTLHLTDLNIYL